MDRETINQQLSEVQRRVNLQEGIFGLTKLLGLISRYQVITTKKLSQEGNIPVPICVAIKNEFIKMGWCEKKPKGTGITEKGLNVARNLGILAYNITCSDCLEQGYVLEANEYEEVLAILHKYSQMRGKPDTTIDQSFATPETSVLRVLYMNHKFDLTRRNFVFIGDSDLTCLALALMVSEDYKITVFDIDSKLEDIIKLANKEHNLSIEFVNHDLRKPIPDQYLNKFHCAITDPPYTRNGNYLFLSRGIDLLSDNKDSVIYLSFGTKTPREMIKVQQDITELGCIITDILPKFNKYVGAQKLGGVSTLYRLSVISESKSKLKGDFDESIYTGEHIKTMRLYRCKNCHTEIPVGYEQEYSTIEALKSKGCPSCGEYIFIKLSEKKIE
jgi:predicted methyltransferase